MDELQTERSTVVASTRPAPLSDNTISTISSTGKQSQSSNKPTTPSLLNSSSTLNTETSDQLVRRSSSGKTNTKGMLINVG